MWLNSRRNPGHGAAGEELCAPKKNCTRRQVQSPMQMTHHCLSFLSQWFGRNWRRTGALAGGEGVRQVWGVGGQLFGPGACHPSQRCLEQGHFGGPCPRLLWRLQRCVCLALPTSKPNPAGG